jgi:hypothetical protein
MFSREVGRLLAIWARGDANRQGLQSWKHCTSPGAQMADRRAGKASIGPPSPFPMAFLRTNAALRVKRIRGTAGAIGKGSRRDGTD